MTREKPNAKKDDRIAGTNLKNKKSGVQPGNPIYYSSSLSGTESIEKNEGKKKDKIKRKEAEKDEKNQKKAEREEKEKKRQEEKL